MTTMEELLTTAWTPEARSLILRIERTGNGVDLRVRMESADRCYGEEFHSMSDSSDSGLVAWMVGNILESALAELQRERSEQQSATTVPA